MPSLPPKKVIKLSGDLSLRTPDITPNTLYDMRDVTHVSSFTIGKFVPHMDSVRITNVSRNIRDIFHVLRMDHIITVEPSAF
jgi:hypothetical protein